LKTGDRYLNQNEAASMVAKIKKFIATVSWFCLNTLKNFLESDPRSQHLVSMGCGIRYPLAFSLFKPSRGNSYARSDSKIYY